MSDYQELVIEEIASWEKELLKKPRILSKTAKQFQVKVNNKIPKRIHDTITTSIKTMVKTVLTGSDWLDRRQPQKGNRLFECDQLVDEKIKQYRKTAMVEGAATGAGGLFLGVADFPLLLGIKMKFLYDTAGCYGYDVKSIEERIFILYIFQLVFSDYTTRKKILPIIKNWESAKPRQEDFNWQSFQQDYRDYIDLAKLLQLVPGFGALVGGYANYRFLNDLGETAKNCYRIRYMVDNK